MSQLPVPSSQYPVVSASQGFAITPSDSVNLPKCTLKIYVGGTGDLTCILNNQPPSALTGLDPVYTSSGVTLAGNVATGTATLGTTRTFASVSSGKYLVEVTVENMGGNTGTNAQQVTLGICDAAFPNNQQLGQYSGDLNSIGLITQTLGNHSYLEFGNGSIGIDFGAASGIVNGDVIGLALDLTTGANVLHIYKNGTLIGSFDMTANGLGGLTWFFAATLVDINVTPSATFNFGPSFAHPLVGYSPIPPVNAIVPVTFKSLAKGFYDLAIAKVLSTGTSATELVGLV